MTVSADGDLDALGDGARRRGRRRASRPTRVDGTVVARRAGRARGVAARRSFSVAERHGFDVTDLSVAEPTLETVFINLTGKDLRE